MVPNFIAQALRGEPLTVYGDGSQTRSFCYVSDLVDGIVRLLRRPIIFDGRNLYEPEVMREHGFTYLPIGRVVVRPAAPGR